MLCNRYRREHVSYNGNEYAVQSEQIESLLKTTEKVVEPDLDKPTTVPNRTKVGEEEEDTQI